MDLRIIMFSLGLTLINGILIKFLELNYVTALEKLSLGGSYEIEKSPLITDKKQEYLQVFVLSVMAFTFLFMIDLFINFIFSLEYPLLSSIEFGLYGYLAVQGLGVFFGFFSFRTKSTIRMEHIFKREDLFFLTQFYGKGNLDVSVFHIKDRDAAIRILQQLSTITDFRSLHDYKERLGNHQPSEKRDRLMAELQLRIDDKKREHQDLFDDLYKAVKIKNPLQRESEELAKIEGTLLSDSSSLLKTERA